MKRKNIYIIPSIGYGGAESFLVRLIPHMKYENIIITLFNTKYDKDRLKNIKVKYITLDPLRTSIKDLYSFFQLAFSLNKKDIIFSWLYIADLFASFLKIFLFWKKFKLIWNVRNTIIDIHQYSLASYFSYLILKSLLYRIPNKIIFNSKESMNQHKKNGKDEKKCFLIHNGFTRHASINKKKNKNTSFSIIYVARLHKQKNHKLLFESLKILSEKYKFHFNVHLVGKNIDRNNFKLIQKLKELNIYQNIILHGLLDQASVHELFSKCDITLLLSNYGESFPNVIAEAMLYGTFPIATNIGETSNIVGSFGDIIPINQTPLVISRLIYKYYLEKKNNFNFWEQRIKDCQDFSYDRFKIQNIAKKFLSISNS